MDEQLDIFSAFEEVGPQAWSAQPKPPPAKVGDVQQPLVTPGGLIPDGEAFARPIKPHSRRKADLVFRYANTVSVAMARKWKIVWLDLFAGPGAVYDEERKQFGPAIPMQVLGLKQPFSYYVFNDKSEECVASLKHRIGDRSDVRITNSDANDKGYLEVLTHSLPRKALVIAYLDPTKLNLHLETIRILAWRFRRLDLLINFPVQAIDRSIAAGYVGPVERVIGHPDPKHLVQGGAPHERIRSHFRQELGDMGFPADKIRGHEIRSADKQVPMYDLMLASRDAKAVELYEKATKDETAGQRGLGLQLAS